MTETTYSIFCKGDKYGIRSGDKIIVKPGFKKITVEHGVYVVQTFNDRFGLISKDCNFVVAPKFLTIQFSFSTENKATILCSKGEDFYEIYFSENGIIKDFEEN